MERDPLDIEVEKLAHQKYGDDADALLFYWNHYKAKILKIFRDEYAKKEMPRWLNYELFKSDMVLEMADKLFQDIIDNKFLNGKKKSLVIDFSFVLGVALGSSGLDTGASGIWDHINDLEINMKIRYLIGG